MNATLSAQRILLAAVILVAAWAPAAAISSPGGHAAVQTTDSEAELRPAHHPAGVIREHHDEPQYHS